MRMYYDQDANQGRLTGKTVAVIGYGSQGHAHAQNLRDSGVQVVVGLRQGKSWKQAEADGFSVMTVGEAAQAADILMILLPDERQSQVYHEEILPNLRAEQLILFAHGFNIHFGQIQPPSNVDVAMVAPKGPGHMVRRVYTEGGGVPSLIAVHQDSTGHAFDTALAYAWAIGGTRAGVIETSFREETETDLFGEQTVLCGGISELVKAGFDTLVEAGYAPEMAYFECLHELKLIVDLMYEGGLARMRYSISDTAEFGDYVTGSRIIGPEVRERMKQVLSEIQTGQFARSWILENQTGRAFFNAKRRLEAQHPVEEVGSRLREMMTWIQSR